MAAYENYGDVNFFENGLMIMDIGDDQYEILTCDFVNDADGDTYLFSHGLVDLSDSWLKLDEVREYAGEEHEGAELVADIVRYWGPIEFNGGYEETLSSAEVMEAMEGFAEEYDFDEFPWRNGPLN